MHEVPNTIQGESAPRSPLRQGEKGIFPLGRQLLQMCGWNTKDTVFKTRAWANRRHREVELVSAEALEDASGALERPPRT